MQIVIDISEENFTCLKDAFESDDWMQQKFAERESAELLFREGTILPKGHGRLVDGDALRDRMYHEAFETDTDFQRWDSGCWIRYKMFEQIEETAPTIINADKENE